MIANLGLALQRSLRFHESESSAVIPKTALSNSALRIPRSQSRARKPAAFQESQCNQQPRVILDKYDFNKCWKIRKLQALGSCDFYHTESLRES